jgi:hypothetical protein
VTAMGSVKLGFSIALLKVGTGLILVLGVIMLLEGPLKIMSHDYEVCFRLAFYFFFSFSTFCCRSRLIIITTTICVTF